MEGSVYMYAFLLLLTAWLFSKWYSEPLRHIPTAGGPSIPLLSYLGSVRFARHPDDVLQEGYTKYHGRAFKVALPDRWMVVVSGLDRVEDIRRRPDSQLALSAAANQLLQRDRILGGSVHETHWHSEVLRTTFTQSLPFILPDLFDELPSAVRGNLPCTDEWIVVNVRPAVLSIIAQLTNRVFVGLPLCRDQAYLKLAIEFAVGTMKDAKIMKLTPRPLRPLAARYLTNTRRTFLEGRAYIDPMVSSRRTKMAQFSDNWGEKPHDLLQCFMDYTTDKATSDEMVAQRLFQTNFAAIHTSSLSMTNALKNLASSPECIAPLRAEVEELIASYGWTKDAIDRMWQVDSFVRESQRLHTLAPVVLSRVAMQDLTLVDGTFVPQGTLVAAAVAPAHRDSNHYPRADVFDPFRFSRLREEKGPSATQAFTHTSGKWLAFGHGKHACPGRFFAADALKALLAYIIVNYDIKEGEVDSAASSGAMKRDTSPGSMTGTVIVRKRELSSTLPPY